MRIPRARKRAVAKCARGEEAPETQPKLLSPPRRITLSPRGDVTAASDGEANNEEAGEHRSNGATNKTAATAMDEAEAEEVFVEDHAGPSMRAPPADASSAEGRGGREGRRAAPPTDVTPTRTSHLTEERISRMGDQSTTDPQSHGFINANNPLTH